LILANIKEPSNNRNWELWQQVLQTIEIKDIIITQNTVIWDIWDKQIKIKSLRDYNWTNIWKETNYKDISFNISDIIWLEVWVSHFSVKESIAHIFIVFNLKNNKDIALSIEARRDNGEEFSLLGWVKFDYELIYILASLEDLVSLREKRNEKVYIYPIKINASKSQELFLLLSKEVNSLYSKPEFYHLIFKNCTNLIVDKVNKISDKRFPLYEQTLAPWYAWKALFEMWLINTELKTFESVQEKFLVNF